jgi:hypothetical protein
MPGVERSKRAARNDDSGSVLVTCRLATVHSGAPGRSPIRPNGPFHAPGPDHDPSRVPPGRGNGGFFRRAWRGHGGCLMTAASLPLSLAAGVTRAAPHAVNLAPVASPANKSLRTAAGTQEHSAGNFINTSGWTCSARAITAPRASRFQQDWDLRQMVSSTPEGILMTT